MRILVTGGLGFIGTAVAETLRADGHQVTAMDARESTDRDPRDFLRGSVLAPADCARACAGADTIVHSAAMHSAAAVAANPLAAIELNVKGTINLLAAGVAAGARRFIFLSSAKVYGDATRLPSAEDDALEPVETYALSKAAAEYHLHLQHETAGIEIVIVRPFSVYGPGQDLGSGYVGMLLSSLLGQRDVTMPGRAEFRRDFVHIDDVTWLLGAAISSRSLPSMTILNAGSGEAHSLGALLETASSITGKETAIGFRVPSADTLTRSHACLQRCESLLGYRPRYSLRDGLTDTIDWFTATGVARPAAK
ncbi:MAG: NAD-dependent epimerase/dehydratase family protein [Gammaproteobacteria bacterium]